MELPATRELVERLKAALDEAHRDWAGTSPRSAGIGTQALKRRIWEMGFEFPRVYPTASKLGRGAAALARSRLAARSATYWGPREEHSTLKEFQYDVAWVEYDAEYTGNGAPAFKRLVLALESEFGGKWEVLLDFHKLLCARAELRVMVWYPKTFRAGHEALISRLKKAGDWAEGHWLLSAWDDDGFTHHTYEGPRSSS